ncbi:MAG: phosphohistidine phosphatase SixA [Thiohalobacterales bacterium]
MRLYLVQHGEAVAKDVDPERPLSEQGVHDVTAIAGALRHAGIRVERVWHSGKCRAEQTAEILAKQVVRAAAVEPVDGIHPNDPVAVFAEDADVWDQDTLVVGHLPFMARLVSLLASGDPEQAVVRYSPGSVVCLERRDTDWVILWMLRPELFADRVEAS